MKINCIDKALPTIDCLPPLIYLSPMYIPEEALRHWIEHFYGYGSWKAKFWFVAHEESGGDIPEDVAERLQYFISLKSGHEALCDLRDLYSNVSARIEGPRARLFRTLYDYRFGANAIQHNGWKNLISFAHGYDNKKLPDLFAYQKKSFASGSRETLINLYPLPAPHNHAWYYSWLDMPAFGFLRSRSAYQQHVYTDRIKTILTNIKQYKPEVVLMYGMSNIQELKSSVKSFFPQTVFTLVKGIKQEIPQHHATKIDGTVLLITTQVPTLRHNRMETGFDWFAFGKMISKKFS